MSENIYTYRDMVPVPLESRGRVGCDLALSGQNGRIRIEGEGIRLDMIQRARYVKHIRD